MNFLTLIQRSSRALIRTFASSQSQMFNSANLSGGRHLRYFQRRAFSRSSSCFNKPTLKIFEEMKSRESRTIEISKIIQPADANPYGRMHGGNVLRLLEEAGIIAATRHINVGREANQPPCVASLVRMEKVEFRHAINIGDIVDVDAEVTFTSARSCEVCVTMESLGIVRGETEKKLAATAFLWFVPVFVNEDAGLTVAKMPQLKLSEERHAEGLERYLSQKQSRSSYAPARQKAPLLMAANSADLFDLHTVRASQSNLSCHVNVSDCDIHRMMRGGVVLKMADEVAGIVAFRHCRGLVVTATVDACNFNKPVPVGSIILFDSYVTFTSEKSMEIEVVVHSGNFDQQTLEPKIFGNVFNALYTFVTIDMNGKPVKVPPLKLETDAERKVFEQGRQRYETRIKERNK